MSDQAARMRSRLNRDNNFARSGAKLSLVERAVWERVPAVWAHLFRCPRNRPGNRFSQLNYVNGRRNHVIARFPNSTKAVSHFTAHDLASVSLVIARQSAPLEIVFALPLPRMEQY